jgi:hypothetical protein
MLKKRKAMHEIDEVSSESNRSIKSITEIVPEHHFDVLSDGATTYDSTFEKVNAKKQNNDNDIN